ncbi:3235_t:CDS:2, partial [Acaulospora colombiana]
LSEAEFSDMKSGSSLLTTQRFSYMGMGKWDTELHRLPCTIIASELTPTLSGTSTKRKMRRNTVSLELALLLHPSAPHSSEQCDAMILDLKQSLLLAQNDEPCGFGRSNRAIVSAPLASPPGSRYSDFFSLILARSRTRLLPSILVSIESKSNENKDYCSGCGPDNNTSSRNKLEICRKAENRPTYTTGGCSKEEVTGPTPTSPLPLLVGGRVPGTKETEGKPSIKE